MDWKRRETITQHREKKGFQKKLNIKLNFLNWPEEKPFEELSY